jgi:hypothetical protein
VPLATKVNILNTQISGDQELLTGVDFEDGAVIANTSHQGPAIDLPGQSSDAFDQLSFSSRQDSLTIAKKAGGFAAGP